MVNIIKKYKFVLLAAIVVIAALAIAFFSGGKVQPSEGAVQETASTAAAATSATVPASVHATQTATSATAATAPTAAPSATAATPSTLPQATAAPVQDNHAVIPAEQSVSAAQNEQHQQQTAPASNNQPQPVEPQEQTVKPVKHRCTISVSCATLLPQRETLNEDIAELVPDDGMILSPVAVTFNEGENVFDVLQRTCQSKGVHLEFTSTYVYNSAYIEGIGNLYEFDCGSGSGWMYKVNGWFPNYGCSRYAVQDGDVIEWLYTCNLGRDIGGENIRYTD